MSTENNLKPCSFYVGNAAAMRDALVRVDKFLSVLGKWLKVNDEGQEYALAAGVIHTLVEHALSAPARNCDRYKDAETARQAWLDDADNWDDFGSSKLELHEWLFAPAKE